MSFTPSPMTPNPPTAVLRSTTPPPIYSPDGLAHGRSSQERGESSNQSFSSFHHLDTKTSSPTDEIDEALILDGALPGPVRTGGSMSTARAPASLDYGLRLHDSSTASLRSVQSTSKTVFRPDTSYSMPASTADITVTPLHLLGDQADFVDCPFCRRRVETRIKKNASAATHIAATGLFFTTVGGVVAPYAAKWKCHISHFCTNCGKKVAVKRHGSDEMKALGTPDHLRQVSKFPAAVTQYTSNNYGQ
ncbi:unnamed protein product [Clonostachys rosea f. rosea IK726]|uniref:Uncharacterized protein n=1 Tax=Clonostachys rosea f. rosea IK726 TaxID=1349383 RepID=A0ACA9T5T7_BIOOC|nr:unnamed protein product [Clonostachys rosea f. rosea IK726]